MTKDIAAAIPFGAAYEIELVDRRTGEVVHRETARNLVPEEGTNAAASVLFAGAAAPAAFYIGLYGGDYTPLPTVTAATLPGLAAELTSYSEPSRVLFDPDPVSAGAALNTGSKAEFNFSDPTTVRGAFITTASSKGATTGTLFSVVRFPSAKQVDADITLRVHAGFQFISL